MKRQAPIRTHSLQHRLILTTVAKVAEEAFAYALRVVAETSARAIPSFGGTIAIQYILARRTFLERTVGASVSDVALASNMLGGIPGVIVGSTGRLG